MQKATSRMFLAPVADSPDLIFLFSTPDVVSTFFLEDGLLAVFIIF